MTQGFQGFFLCLKMLIFLWHPPHFRLYAIFFATSPSPQTLMTQGFEAHFCATFFATFRGAFGGFLRQFAHSVHHISIWKFGCFPIFSACFSIFSQVFFRCFLLRFRSKFASFFWRFSPPACWIFCVYLYGFNVHHGVQNVPCFELSFLPRSCVNGFQHSQVSVSK